jgi:hypothetical protein
MEDMEVLKLIEKTGERSQGRGRPSIIWTVSEYTQKLWKRSLEPFAPEEKTTTRRARRLVNG